MHGPEINSFFTDNWNSVAAHFLNPPCNESGRCSLSAPVHIIFWCCEKCTVHNFHGLELKYVHESWVLLQKLQALCTHITVSLGKMGERKSIPQAGLGRAASPGTGGQGEACCRLWLGPAQLWACCKSHMQNHISRCWVPGFYSIGVYRYHCRSKYWLTRGCGPVTLWTGALWHCNISTDSQNDL